MKDDKDLVVDYTKGFTLIELLVVIAIIGILASVVLSSLSSARDKGKDAAVKSQLSSMRAQAELWYNDHNESYNGICTGRTDENGFGGQTPLQEGLLKATTEVNSVSSGLHIDDSGALDATTCQDSVDAWVVESPIMVDSNTVNMYCVDSTGATTVKDTPLVNGALKC